MAAARQPLDPALLPAVRSAQGALVASIFSHAAFDAEGERKYGKLFYVFEETIANNEALEVAHLGEDTENATRAALENSIENNSLIADDVAGREGDILRFARQKYGAQRVDVGEIEDVDLGEVIRRQAGQVRDAARRALGTAETDTD